jgi:hypothetical protein
MFDKSLLKDVLVEYKKDFVQKQCQMKNISGKQ